MNVKILLYSIDEQLSTILIRQSSIVIEWDFLRESYYADLLSL